MRPAGRSRRITAARFVVLFCGAVLGCDSSDERAALQSGAAGEWSVTIQGSADTDPQYERVVLVTIDTLRADHVSSYGYPRQTTPFLDRLAARGVRFTRAIAAVSHTAPSHATMLTGLVPAVHGVVHNGGSLDPRTLDLAGAFGQAGFETGAFLNVKFLGGVARSFDTVKVLSVGGEAGKRRDLNSRDVVDAALEWVAKTGRGERFFLWVHLYDPHRWKDAVVAQTKRGGSLWQGATPDGFFENLLALHGLPEPRLGEPYRIPWTLENEKRPAELEMQSARGFLECIDAYDSLIRFTDLQVQRLYDGIERADSTGRSLWIVTSDHGEGLASHGVAGHGGRIYQEQLVVPLVLHASDDSLAPRVVAALVAHVDLFATLAETLGARVTGRRELYEGRSLWPLMNGAGDWAPRQLFSQRRPAENDADPDQAEVYALQDGRHKYILHEPGEDEFFALEGDPRELVDQGAGAREAAELRTALEQRLRVFEGLSPRSAEAVPEEWMDELRDLGYVR